MAELELQETYVGNRLTCKCGGDRFFLAAESSYPDVRLRPVVDNIECINCHQMYTVTIKTKQK